MNKFIKLQNKVLEIDRLIYKKLYKFNNNFYINIFTNLGNIFIILIFLLIFYFLPINNIKEITMISLISIILNTIIIFLIKYTVRRKRKEEKNPLIIKIETYSFPSGHVNRVAGIIIPFYNIPILSLFFLIITLIVAFARIAKGYHYFSDCIVGFIIGIGVGIIVKIFSYLYAANILNLIDLIKIQINF